MLSPLAMRWGLEERNKVARSIEYLMMIKGIEDHVSIVTDGFALTQIILDLQNDKLMKFDELIKAYKEIYGDLPNEPGDNPSPE